MATTLAGSGAAVVVAHHGEPDRAADVVAGIGAAGGVAVAFDGDLSTVAANERLVSFAARELGRVDVFVANAGLTRWKPFLEMDEATWDEVVDLNLKGSYFGAQAAARRMVEQGGGGRIVLSSSVTGTRRRRQPLRLLGDEGRAHAHGAGARARARAARDHGERPRDRRDGERAEPARRPGLRRALGDGDPDGPCRRAARRRRGAALPRLAGGRDGDGPHARPSTAGGPPSA